MSNITLEQYQSTAYCTTCNAPINEDGTVTECFGECDRDISPIDYSFKPLDFSDSQIMEEVLPTIRDFDHDFEVNWSEDFGLFGTDGLFHGKDD